MSQPFINDISYAPLSLQYTVSYEPYSLKNILQSIEPYESESIWKFRSQIPRIPNESELR